MPIKFRCLAEQQQAPCHRPTTASAFNASQRVAGTRKIVFRKWCLSRIGRRMSTKGHQDRTIQVVSSANDIRITAPNVELESFPDHLPKRCILFHYPETECLANSIAAASGSRVELGEIKWGCVAVLRSVASSPSHSPFVSLLRSAVRTDLLLHLSVLMPAQPWPSCAGHLQMASRTCLSRTQQEYGTDMWLSWRPFRTQPPSLSSCPSSTSFRACLWAPSHWSCLISQLAQLSG